MTSFDEARIRAQVAVDHLAERMKIDLAIAEEATRSEDWCWIFFYDSRAHIETGSFRHALAGNGPFVVVRATGALHELNTARPIDEQLEELHESLISEN